MTQIIIASGPVIVENNKVLLNKDKKDNFWKFCGGRINEEDFNVKETTKREVKEEMGLDVEIFSNDPFFFYTEKEIDGEKVSVILIHFLAKRLGEISPGEETIDWKWIDIVDLKNENLAPNIIPVLEHFGFKEK